MNLDLDITQAFVETRMTRSECAAFLGVSTSTLRRWLNKGDSVPKSAIEALRMLAGYTPRLSKRGKEFKGWRFKDGMLWTDEGMSFSPSEIRSIWHVDQLVKGQAREIRDLKSLLEELQSSLEPVLPGNVILFSDYKRA